ncbi:MAG: NAD-dependent epimerase/dehydratase family protein, partial [Bryobacteraceae bacterium]
MNIAISGASGFIGRHLVKSLAQAGHSPCVLSRHAPPVESDVVIHLAGEPLAQRWTSEAKRRIRESRVMGTRKLVEALGGLSRRPEALICASAIGYYGSRGDDILTESSAPGAGFLPEVCVAWEREAQAAEAFGIR